MFIYIGHRPLPTTFLTYSESTLMKSPVSVANKELTGSLGPLDSTLTKNGGGGVMVNQLPRIEP